LDNSTTFGVAIGVLLGNLFVYGLVHHNWNRGFAVGVIAAVLVFAIKGFIGAFK
jgi:hypothetical protein